MEFSHTPQNTHTHYINMPRKSAQIISADIVPADAAPLPVVDIELEPVPVEAPAPAPTKKPRAPRAKKVAEPVVVEPVVVEPIVAEPTPEPVVVEPIVAEPTPEPVAAPEKKPRKPRAKKVEEPVAVTPVADPIPVAVTPVADLIPVAEPGAPVKAKRTRKPSAYNMLLGEFMRKIAQEEDKLPRNERMAKAQSMYRDWKSERAAALVAV
jgi:hypothetical protein